MLVNLRHRSKEQELMDNPLIEEKALKTALSDVSRVNKMLGGNAITIKAVHKLVSNHGHNKELVILDLGCGDGEMLRGIANFFRKKNKKVKLIGLDLNEKSLSYAKTLSISYPEITFVNLNLLEIDETQFNCDIIICTLTLHHLSCEEIKNVMKKSVKLASVGVIINDLQRSVLAYYLFKIFSLFFIKGYVAKNDGLVSIKRGFRKAELVTYASNIGLKKYRIDWKWAFRYRWVIETGPV